MRNILEKKFKKKIKEMFNKIFVINPGFKIPDIPIYFLI
jgi:hypothetical protein